MKHRNGGKMCGRHTTCTDLTARVVDVLTRLDFIRKASLGKMKKTSGNCGTYVKIEEAPPGRLILMVKQPHVIQELNIYTDDLKSAQQAIVQVLTEHKIPVPYATDLKAAQQNIVQESFNRKIPVFA